MLFFVISDFFLKYLDDLGTISATPLECERTIAEKPRTNNILEGWHRRFNTIVAKHHPNIYEFIYIYVRKGNERILRVVQSYGDRDNMEYLRGIGYNLSY